MSAGWKGQVPRRLVGPRRVSVFVEFVQDRRVVHAVVSATGLACMFIFAVYVFEAGAEPGMPPR
jgi:hypothetical protein